MTRSIAELRRAAIDAGFEGDPLTEEILAALAEREHSPGPVPGRSPKGLIIACILACAAIIGLVAVWTNSALKARDTEVSRLKEANATLVAQKDQEIARLKELNAGQITAAAERLQSALAAAESVSKTSASAADSNQSAVNLYMTKFQDMLDELKRLHGTPPAPQPK
jgi:hypothetical protein